MQMKWIFHYSSINSIIIERARRSWLICHQSVSHSLLSSVVRERQNMPSFDYVPWDSFAWTFLDDLPAKREVVWLDCWMHAKKPKARRSEKKIKFSSRAYPQSPLASCVQGKKIPIFHTWRFFISKAKRLQSAREQEGGCWATEPETHFVPFFLFCKVLKIIN